MKTVAMLLSALMLISILTACTEDSEKRLDPPVSVDALSTTDGEPEGDAADEIRFIDELSAFFCALNHAINVDNEDGLIDYYANGEFGYTAELSTEGESAAYHIGIETPEYEYSYKIDAVSGEVISAERRENEVFDPEIIGLIHLKIDEEDALGIALDFFDLSKSDVVGTKSEYDAEKYVFNVSFDFDGAEYVCEISWDGEFLRSNVDIGPSGAKEIAFQNSLDSADNYMMRDELYLFAIAGLIEDININILGSRDDRRYEVGFKVGGYEFYYLIDGLGGEIIDSERTEDPDWDGERAGAGYGAYISEHEAFKAALEHAGVSPDSFKNRRVTLDTTDGHEEYIVIFEADGYIYRCEVNAYTGEVLLFEKSGD